MSTAQRVSLLAGALAALSLILLIFQGATQDVETRTEDDGSGAEQPTYPPTTTGKFAECQIIVELEEEATQSDLAALNQRNGAQRRRICPAAT